MIPFQKTDALYEEAELRYIFRIFGYYIFKFARIYELKPPKKHPYNCSMLIPYTRCARFFIRIKDTYNCSMSASYVFHIPNSCIFSYLQPQHVRFRHFLHLFAHKNRRLFARCSLLLRSFFAPPSLFVRSKAGTTTPNFVATV